MPNWFETPLGQARITELQTAAEKEREAAAEAAKARKTGGFRRSYSAAKSTRFTGGWSTSDSSADAELVGDLRTLRSRSRALCRDSSYAKRARVLCVNNIIGNGMGMQAQVETTRGELNTRINDEIEAAWLVWCAADSCHTGGRLSFRNFERALIDQVFEAGEVFIRKHPVSFGRSRVPFALELIEAERCADDYQSIGPQVRGATIRMGVELDQFHRPIAYWFRERHPGEIRWVGQEQDRLIRVPADQIIHLAKVTRWPQTRGEPWLHTAARRMNDMEGYTEAEMIRARGQAVRMGIITTPEGSESMAEQQEDGTFQAELDPGLIFKLNAGEEWIDSNPTAPNPQLDPFMRYLIREVAVGIGVNYASLSSDYSQSNYSSSRLALLDDRDGWRALQAWFIDDFRTQVHREWLMQAVLSRAVESVRIEEYAADPAKFEAVRFRPRGWGWVDPTKEVNAFKDAVRSGFMTLQDVVSTSGADIEELMTQRKKEVELADEAGLVFDSDPKQVSNAGLTQARPVGTTLPLEQEEAVELAGKKEDPPDDEVETDEPEEPAEKRVFRFPRK